MKIGFCGTMSTGKSTLVKELSKLPEFKDYHIATERSKYLKDLGIQLNTDSTLRGQTIFMAERASELFKENLLTDRTIYDVIAFTFSSKSIVWEQKKLFCELYQNLRFDYDIIFYVDTEGTTIENNGVRETDPIYRDQINQVISAMLVEYPPKKLIRISGSTEDRIKTVLSNLN